MPKEKKRGLFIVLEGIDGSGTTTQTHRLAGWMREKGLKAHATREPSDGPVGVLIRQILQKRLIAPGDKGPVPVDKEAVALLFAADRLDHLHAEIEPRLARGIHVVCDRYVYSSLAYQGPLCGRDWVKEINSRAAIPDLSIFVLLDPREAEKRLQNDGRGNELYEVRKIQEQVAAEYAALKGKMKGHKMKFIRGDLSEDEVFEHIMKEVETLLKKGRQ